MGIVDRVAEAGGQRVYFGGSQLMLLSVGLAGVVVWGLQATAITRQGVNFVVSNQLDLAIEQLNRALALEPANVEAHNNLGLVYRRMNEFDLAERSFLKALAVNRDYGAAHYNLALLYEDTGRLDEARAHYRAFIACPGIDPETAARVEGRLQALSRNLPPVPATGN